jgi:eukaryotic-like serine/threonine-protein kinase
MGTVAYMSPEQAEGRETNARSDIFSLGIVLFELATGERPFKGTTDLETLASIVKESAPAATSVKSMIPAELARIIRRCLAKDPRRRYQTAADIRNDLADLQQELAAGRGSVDVPLQHGRRREALAWAAALALLVTTSYALWSRGPAVEAAVDVSSVLSPRGTTLTDGEAPQLSPDGRRLALVATDSAGHTRLYVRDRASLAMQPLPGTEDAAQPFWSPDGQSLGFFAGGQLKKVAVAGGSPQTLAVAPVPRGGMWSQDGVILFVPFPEEPLQRIAASGGDSAPLPLPSGELR